MCVLYNIQDVLSKMLPACSQILACGYINSLMVNHCWLIQLLSLACTIKDYNTNTKPKCKWCPRFLFSARQITFVCVGHSKCKEKVTPYD